MQEQTEEKIVLNLTEETPMTPELYGLCEVQSRIESGDLLIYIFIMKKFVKSEKIIPFAIESLFSFFDDENIVIRLLNDVYNYIRENMPIIRDKPDQKNEMIHFTFELLISEEMQKLAISQIKIQQIILQIQATVICHFPEHLDYVQKLEENLPLFFSFIQVISPSLKIGLIGAFPAQIEDVKNMLCKSGGQVEMMEIAYQNIGKVENATEALCDLFGWVEVDLFYRESQKYLQALYDVDPLFLLRAFKTIVDRDDIGEQKLEIIENFQIFNNILKMIEDPHFDINNSKIISDLLYKINEIVMPRIEPGEEMIEEICNLLKGLITKAATFNPFPAHLATSNERLLFFYVRYFAGVEPFIVQIFECIRDQISEIMSAKSLPGDPDKRIEVLFKYLIPIIDTCGEVGIVSVMEYCDSVFGSELFLSNSERAFLFMNSIICTIPMKLPDEYIINTFKNLASANLYSARTDSAEQLGLMTAVARLVVHNDSVFLKGPFLEEIGDFLPMVFNSILLSVADTMAADEPAHGIVDRSSACEEAVDTAQCLLQQIPSIEISGECLQEYIVPIIYVNDNGILLNTELINGVEDPEAREQLIMASIEEIEEKMGKEDALKLLTKYKLEGVSQELIDKIVDMHHKIYAAYMCEASSVDVDLYCSTCEACVSQDIGFVSEMLEGVLDQEAPIEHLIVAAYIVAENASNEALEGVIDQVMSHFVDNLSSIQSTVTRSWLCTDRRAKSEPERERQRLLNYAVKTIITIWDNIGGEEQRMIGLGLLSSAIFQEINNADSLNDFVDFVVGLGVKEILEADNNFFKPAEALVEAVTRKGDYDEDESPKILFVFHKLCRAAAAAEGPDLVRKIAAGLPVDRCETFIQSLERPTGDYNSFYKSIYLEMRKVDRSYADEFQADNEDEGEYGE